MLRVRFIKIFTTTGPFLQESIHCMCLWVMHTKNCSIPPHYPWRSSQSRFSSPHRLQIPLLVWLLLWNPIVPLTRITVEMELAILERTANLALSTVVCVVHTPALLLANCRTASVLKLDILPSRTPPRSLSLWQSLGMMRKRPQPSVIWWRWLALLPYFLVRWMSTRLGTISTADRKWPFSHKRTIININTPSNSILKGMKWLFIRSRTERIRVRKKRRGKRRSSRLAATFPNIVIITIRIV